MTFIEKAWMTVLIAYSTSFWATIFSAWALFAGLCLVAAAIAAAMIVVWPEEDR